MKVSFAGKSADSPSLGATEQGLPPSAPATPRLLIVASDGTWTSRALPESGSLTLGRGAEADVRVDERSVSRIHARLEIAGSGQYRLADLGSANGTLVGSELVRSTSVALQPGQQILLGRTVIVVQVPPGPAAQGPGLVAPGPPTASTGTAMVMVEALIAKMAPTLVNVLLIGETGAGKDVAAERIHLLSTRAKGPFLRLNCAGLTPTLLESELFGHERGAFSGAVKAKPGLLEVAAGGTVLLDEIGEMPLEVQAKLLLAIEQRVIRRVGALQGTPIDVRFICATHRDLETEIRSDRFRADFYYRINGITIRIPPLRDRLDELDGLVAHFAHRAATRLDRARAPAFDPEASARLRAYRWPGNIRELGAIVERAVILTDGEVVALATLLAAGLPESQESPRALAAASTGQPGDAERERILAALAECGGNQSRAAKLLGMSRNTLLARIRQFGIVRPRGV